MSIDLNGFWQSWDVVSGNTQANNQYEFWKGMVMTNGDVLANQYDFFTYHNTTRYEWFKALQGTYPEVWDEYTFYKNTNDDRIFDFKTFYQYGGSYLVSIPVTPTPTPTITPTSTVTPTPSVTATNTPTPTITPTSTVTPTVTPTSTMTPTPTPSPAVSSINYIGSYSFTNNATTYTENGITLGSPGLVVIAGMGRTGSFAGLEINGVSVSLIGSGSDPNSAIGYLYVTGTTVNVTMYMSQSAANEGFGVYRLNNLNSNTHAGSLTNASATSFAYTSLPANSCIIAVGARTGGVSATWTNATENWDLYVESATAFTGASFRFAAGGNRTISASYASGGFSPTGASLYWV